MEIFRVVSFGISLAIPLAILVMGYLYLIDLSGWGAWAAVPGIMITGLCGPILIIHWNEKANQDPSADQIAPPWALGLTSYAAMALFVIPLAIAWLADPNGWVYGYRVVPLYSTGAVGLVGILIDTVRDLFRRVKAQAHDYAP